MEFLNFLAQRLNVTPSEAGRRLERTLNNYRPLRDYSSRMIEPHEIHGSAPMAPAIAAHRSPQADRASIPCMRYAHLQQ